MNVVYIYVLLAFYIYMKKKANLFHIKEEIDPFISIDIKCPEHPTVPMNLFCSREKSKNYIIYIITPIKKLFVLCVVLIMIMIKVII